MSLVETSQNSIEPPRFDWVGEFLMEYGKNTRSAYASDLKRFFGFCSAFGYHHQDATRAVCSAFCRHESEVVGQSAATVARRLSAVSAYFKYALCEGYVDTNPMEAVRRPKVSKDTTSTGLTKDQLASLIEAAKWDGQESYALILLLAMNGLRISEALNIAVEDIGMERGVLTVQVERKGGRISTVPLNNVTAGVIERLAFLRGEGKLFDMDRYGAWRLVKRLGGDHPHALRHTFATNALEAGATLYDVQQACDHADPRTTERYLHSMQNLDNHPTFLLGGDND